MLDGLLLKAIQALSRATKVETVASLLLKIIHQQLVLEKSILILDKPLQHNKITDFSLVVADCSNQVNSSENKNATKPQINFIVDRASTNAPFSLLEHCRHQSQPKVVFEIATDFEDIYLKQQKPYNFSYFPIVDRQQFFGILYLENISNRNSLTTQTKKAILLLATQVAIALNKFEQNRDRAIYAKTLETQLEQQKQAQKTLKAKIQQKLLLEKIVQKIRSTIDLEAVFETAVREIGTALKVTRCQIHSYIQTSEPKIPVFAVYDESQQAETHYLPVQFPTMGIDTERFQHDRPIAVDNVVESPLLKLTDSVFKHWKIKSLLTVRTSYQGKVNGLIMLHQCDRFRQWTTAEITTMETVAAQVGIAIAYANLLKREKQQRVALDRQNYLLQREIGDRKQAQIALQHSEELYRTIFDQVAIGIIEKDYESNRIIRANVHFCAITGYKESELLNRTFIEITHPEDVEQTLALIEQLKTGQIERFSLEKRYICQNGSFVWAKTTICPLGRRGKTTSCIAVIEDITTIKQDQEKLKQQSAAMEAAIDGIAILERDRFVYLNLSYAVIFGYDNPVELLGQSWQILYEPEEAKKLQQVALPIFTQQGYWRGESQGKKKDGTLFDEEIALIKLDDNQMVCICRDIGDRKQQEKQLKASQQRYRALAAAAPVGIFRTDAEGNFTYVNERWCNITQLTFPEAMNRGWLKAIHVKDREMVTQQWQKAIENQTSFSREYRFLAPDGVEIWVFGQAIAEYHEEGKLLGYVGTITNISQLKESQKVLAKQLGKEQLLSQITQEIRRNLNTKAIFQTAAIQIGQIYQASRCLIHNYLDRPHRQVPLVAQYSSQDNVSLFDRPIPVVGNPHLEKVLSQDLAVVSFDVEREPRLAEVREICQKFEIKSLLTVRTSYQGKPNGLIGLHQCDRYREWSTDEVELLEAVALQMGIAIAQAQLLEKEQQQRQELYLNNLALTKAKHDAEVANQAKSQFLAHMSHELRTPLNAILGFSQIMVSDPALDSSQQEQLTIINRSGQHLLNLINNILDLSKIEAGKTYVQQNHFDLYDFIGAIEKMFQLQAQTKGLQLSINLNPDVPQYIVTDGVKLKQIIINLLSNALKFTTEGAVSLQVKSQQQSLIFKITDSGAGIAKAELDRIFEPFEQTDTGIKSGQGTGLGLSICRSLIKLLDGMLEVESVVDGGTTFLFQIPIQIADADAIALAQISQHSAIATLDSSYPHNPNTDPAVNLEELNNLPIQWLEKLHHAAISASDRKINNLIDLIADEHPTLAANLKEMVANFALEGIIDQTESLLDLK